MIANLTPSPANRDSGVEWLGEEPGHWEVAALRHLATKFGSGSTLRGGATVYVPRGVPFLRSQNVHYATEHDIAKEAIP